MSSLTSFDALHEPSQHEDPPENVLSKIFQRVKSTLSTSSTPPTSGTPPSALPAGMSSKNTLSSITCAPSLSSRNHATTSSSSVSSFHPSSAMTSITISTAPTTAASSIVSDQTVHALEQVSSSSATSSNSSPLTLSESGSWDVSSDGKSGNNGTQLGTQIGQTTSNTITRKMEDKDRPPVVRRSPNTLNAPKRASSLFKVSTVDHSIVQDDDSASLSSLAPPVVSLSPAFGDQRTAKDKSPEVSGAMVIRNADSRTPDPSRLSVSMWR